MSKPYDAIIIGGGHNGLTCAAYLARAGQTVLVLEKRPLVGGATVTEEIVPGFHFTVFSYLVSLLRTEIIQELELVKHGLMLLPFESTLDLAPDGHYLYREADHWKTYRNIASHSRRDAEAYDDYKLSMRHLAHALRQVMNAAPPNLDLAGADRPALADMARHLTDLGEPLLRQFIQLLTMSAADFLAQWFESEIVQAALATSGIIGSMVSPKTPGSALVLLYHYLGEMDGEYRAWKFAKGGTGAVADALASAARAHGAEIRTEAPVARLLRRQDEVTGVVLESGEELQARTVVSSLTPQMSFLRLVGEESLPADFVAQIKHWNSLGSAGKVNLALAGEPEFAAFKGRRDHLAGAFSFNVSLDSYEKAYDEAKLGAYSSAPYIDSGLISMADPDLAPPGSHVMTCFVMYAPYHLKEGTWPEKREAFGQNVVDNLERYIPNIRRILVGMQVNTPWDIEERIGLTGGNIFHGELRLGQMFGRRPAAGTAGYGTPLANYFVCGSSAHPGGAISGAPGRNAARQILQRNNGRS